MKLGTFKEGDYLVIAPYAWGRAKTPKEAFRAMKSNYSESYGGKDATCHIYRLTDNTNTVDVNHTGGFHVDSAEQPYLVAQLPVNIPVKYILDEYTVPSFAKAE